MGLSGSTVDFSCFLFPFSRSLVCCKSWHIYTMVPITFSAEAKNRMCEHKGQKSVDRMFDKYEQHDRGAHCNPISCVLQKEN